MTRTAVGPARAEAGFSVVEALVAVVLFGLLATGLALSSLFASRNLTQSRVDGQVWHAVHEQLEQLRAQGYSAVASGSGTTHGFPMTWTVQGSDPKKIILVVQARRWNGQTAQDTVVTYLAAP